MKITLKNQKLIYLYIIIYAIFFALIANNVFSMEENGIDINNKVTISRNLFNIVNDDNNYKIINLNDNSKYDLIETLNNIGINNIFLRITSKLVFKTGNKYIDDNPLNSIYYNVRLNILDSILYNLGINDNLHQYIDKIEEQVVKEINIEISNIINDLQ